MSLTRSVCADGELDATFSFDGKVITALGEGNDWKAYSLAIDSSGRIVAAGSAFNGVDVDFALARYNEDGSLDGSFGVGGVVTTDFAGYEDYGYAVAIDLNGKIVVAGDASDCC